MLPRGQVVGVTAHEFRDARRWVRPVLQGATLVASSLVDIIVDTNILVADYQLHGTAFRVAFDGIQRTDCTLLVPEVVVAEVIGKYREHMLEALTLHRKGRTAFQRITGRPLIEEQPIETAVDTEIRDFAERFPRMLTSRGARLLPWPNIDHQAVVGRLLGGRRPMRNDVGYRDTLIWESIIAHLKSSMTEAVFVTHNTKDFFEGGVLHTDLLQDLRDAGIEPARLSIEESLFALNKRLFEPTLALLDGVKDQLQREAYPGVDLRGWATTNLGDVIEDDDLRGAATNLPQGCGSVHLSSEYQVTGFEVVDVRRLSSGELLVEVHFKANGEVATSVDGDDYDRFSEAREWLGSDYDGGSVDGYVPETFTATFEFIISEGRIQSHELTGMEGNYGDWTIAH